MARTITTPSMRQAPRNNPTPSGIPQGTPGGVGSANNRARGKRSMSGMGAMGPEKYLWILLAIELTLMYMLRQRFRRYHGG